MTVDDLRDRARQLALAQRRGDTERIEELDAELRDIGVQKIGDRESEPLSCLDVLHAAFGPSKRRGVTGELVEDTGHRIYRELREVSAWLQQHPVERDIPTRKRCPYCEEVRHAKHFHRDAASRDGLQTYCSDCHNDYRRERYAEQEAA